MAYCEFAMAQVLIVFGTFEGEIINHDIVVVVQQLSIGLFWAVGQAPDLVHEP